MQKTLVSVQAQLVDRDSWVRLARRVEATGYDALLTADHPGTSASPFVALAAAALVTERIKLGSYVSHAGVREPLLLASDVATLDVLSAGRARLGLGAGHTPVEWEMVGSRRPDVAGRVRRFLAVAEACRALLAGEQVTTNSPELRARHAQLTGPRPVQEVVPLVVGGGNTALLRWAGKNADVVALSGLGRTLADGHSHETRWSEADIDRQVEAVTQGAEGRVQPPDVEALVQVVEVTDDLEGAAERLAATFGTTPAEVLDSPYVWVGTVAEIADAIARHDQRWGITRYVVREPHLKAADLVLAHLRSRQSR
ncbi:LLM class flavin-dependent oxidoreductase [Streptomyces sp. NBC_00448]|uniref:LLM class flavin-dependent oxidoreductase n=1 Tax=Streptomyces sp. NBC_00448 TaxID=2903652 RepID=UPI002E1EFA05